MCGISAVLFNHNSFIENRLMLHNLQHRGYESCGIGNSHTIIKNYGKVNNVFENVEMNDIVSLGHIRYSTTKHKSNTQDIQPLLLDNMKMVHNGNIKNYNKLLNKHKFNLNTTSDSEIILHLIKDSNNIRLIDKIKDAMLQIKGAVSMILLIDKLVFIVRDYKGYRPLVLGHKDDSVYIASETCAFDALNVNYTREINGGEILCYNLDNLESFSEYYKEPSLNPCIFEYIYFAHPSSFVFNNYIHTVRKLFGKYLAIDSPPPNKTDQYIITPVLQSGLEYALGYYYHCKSLDYNCKFDIVLLKNYNSGRTFIDPDNKELKIRNKFIPLKDKIHDKKLIVIDDSIVRGNTSKYIIRYLKENSPVEIHFKSGCPQIIYPSNYGIDFKTKEELISYKYNKNIKDMEEFLELSSNDSLDFLSLDTLYTIINKHLQQSYYINYFIKK